jgi:hypothetical protein
MTVDIEVDALNNKLDQLREMRKITVEIWEIILQRTGTSSHNVAEPFQLLVDLLPVSVEFMLVWAEKRPDSEKIIAEIQQQVLIRTQQLNERLMKVFKQLMDESTQKLVDALVAKNDPRLTEMIEQAKKGYYHNFKSPLATPCLQLVQDLEYFGLKILSARAQRGEFHATKAESDAWAKSKV